MGERRRRAFEAIVTSEWDGFLKGVEKEGLRVDGNGFIAQTPHPEGLGSALTHPAITTDYSEALLELVTPVCRNTDELLRALDAIHGYVHQHLGDELLWPLSMPCRLDGDASIPIAHYGTSNIGQLKTVYRRGLAERYGRVMQSIAGTHYNFSLPDSFWRRWQHQLGDRGPLTEFRTQQYFWLIRNFRRRSWLLMYLFGASPVLDRSFVAGRRHRLAALGEETLYSSSATSLRMSDLGYNNQAQSSLDICFNRLETFTQTLDHAIHTPWPPYRDIGLFRNGERIQISDSVLQIENEYYSAIRPKRTTQSGEKALHALQRRGVEYVEVRCLDLDPFSAHGVSREQINFMDLFLLDCLLADSPLIDDAECSGLDNTFEDVVTQGRATGCQLSIDGLSKGLREEGMRLLERLELLAEMLPAPADYREALMRQKARLDDPASTPSGRLQGLLEAQPLSFVEWGLEQAGAQHSAYRSCPLTPEWQQELEQAARDSRDAQAELEASETEAFEDFLTRYLDD